jgi:hypothetical protein
MQTTSKRPQRKERRRSARADGQQDFLTEGILELLELQGRLTLVAENFEYCRTAFFGYFHAAIFEMDDVHLQRLDLEIPVVAAMWTSQRHERTPLYNSACTDTCPVSFAVDKA